MSALTVPQAFALALQHSQAGRWAEAETLSRQILTVQPGHVDALHLTGVAAGRQGRGEEAVGWLQQAVALRPDVPAIHSSLGEAFRACGRLAEALLCYERALQLKSDDAQASHRMGNALVQLRRPEAAVRAYQTAIQGQPAYADAHNHLGIAFVQLGRLEDAAAAFRSALRLTPASLDYFSNLVEVLTALKQKEEAIAAYRALLHYHPHHADAWNNLGNLLHQQGQWEEAIGVFRHALTIQPQHAVVLYNLGCVLARVNRSDEAINSFREAIRLNTAYASAYHNLGLVLAKKGDLDGAEMAYREVLCLEPENTETRSNLAELFSKQGRAADAVAEYRQILAMRPNALVHGSLIYALQLVPHQDERETREEKRRWNLQYGDGSSGPHQNRRDPERRLKIGYVSADFRSHVVGKNIWPLFQHHDASQFEIVCYSGVETEDALTTQLRARATLWRDTLGMSDEEMAACIQRDGIDILVDLAQHTAGNRLPVFARRPAPVQVSFAGYPESTGLAAISYRISDGYLEKADEAARRTGWLVKESERVYLIDSFWCYAPLGAEVGVNELPAATAGRVTFGSLNSFAKINEAVLRLWSRILMNVPGSRLVLLSGFGKHRQTTWEVLQAWGVTSDRVEFLERRSQEGYLENYHRLDVVLDTFPYGGHTTSLDALWMGVPVVSLAGLSAVSRAGLSQFSNLGLPELVAESEEEYVRIATELAGDLPRLGELRKALRPRLESSVLMNGAAFAQQIERAYRAMWVEWCGLAPLSP